MSIDEKALAAAQKAWHDRHGNWKDFSVRVVIEAYEAAKMPLRGSGDSLHHHASTGLDSFVTRLEKALRATKLNQMVSVNPRDLRDVLYHFIRLDNAARQTAAADAHHPTTPEAK